MKTPTIPAVVAAFLSLLAAPAIAAECDVDKAGSELTGAEAQAVYDCLADALHAGYQQGDKRWIPAEFVSDYRSWTAVSKFPAAPGFHGGRFLLTYVNEVGAEEYLRFKDENVQIPAGTLIAKESFGVDDNGKVAPGPLFIMQKTEAGVSPQSDDWYYMAVAPSGAPMAVDVMTACSECHQGNFGHQGGLGYPAPEARVGQ